MRTLRQLLSTEGASNRSLSVISRLARQRVMRHCLLYLLMNSLMLGLLALSYLCYQLLATPTPLLPWLPWSLGSVAHFTAALTAGRPALGFVGWALINAQSLFAEGGSRLLPNMAAHALGGVSSLTGSTTNMASLQKPLLGAAHEEEPAGFKEELRYDGKTVRR